VADAGQAKVPVYLQVVRGDATPEEIAALVAALAAVAAARASAQRPGKPRPARAWADRSRLMRPAVRASPAGGWRRSGLPGG
jgi:hypothetical protein